MVYLDTGNIQEEILKFPNIGFLIFLPFNYSQSASFPFAHESKKNFR